MKRIIISLLCIITVLCGYFLIHKKTAFINTRTETNSTQQPSAPSPLEQLKTQFKQPFKGRVFQELVSMSGSLNSILYCDTLDVAQRASILSKITNKPYSEMNALVSEVDRCISECCDSPCFAAIQDSIIYSYTDETLDVYWYYKYLNRAIHKIARIPDLSQKTISNNLACFHNTKEFSSKILNLMRTTKS